MRAHTDANLIWAWKDPFGENKDDPKRHAVYQQLRRLTWHQLVNQMPGLGYMASKQELGKLSHSIRAIPRTFQLPSQYEEWQEFIKTDPRGGSMEWIEKLETHRGGQLAMQYREEQHVFVGGFASAVWSVLHASTGAAAGSYVVCFCLSVCC